MPQQPEQDWFAAQLTQGGDDFFAQTDAPAPEGKSLGGFLGNVVSSGVDAVKGAVSMLDPRNWDDMVSQMAQGQRDARAKLLSGESFEAPAAARYGSVDKATDTLYNDPVGAALELAPFARPTIGLSRVKSGLQDAGVRTKRGAVKPNTAEINKMAGASQAGLDKMSDGVARTALTENINPMTRRGLETTQSRIETLGAVRDADIAAAPQVPIAGSGRRQLASVRPVAERYRVQSTPEADVASVVGVGKEIARNPLMTKPFAPGKRAMRDLTPNELNALNKGDNKALAGKFGKVGDAEIDARKAVVSARRDMLDEAVPGTKETGQRMRRLIDLRNVSNVARKRGEGRDAVGLTDMIALSSGRPSTLLLSTAMRPAAQAGLARGLYNAGGALPDALNFTDLHRLALLAELANEGSTEQ
jgi:hypothetical protein